MKCLRLTRREILDRYNRFMFGEDCCFDRYVKFLNAVDDMGKHGFSKKEENSMLDIFAASLLFSTISIVTYEYDPRITKHKEAVILTALSAFKFEWAWGNSKIYWLQEGYMDKHATGYIIRGEVVMKLLHRIACGMPQNIAEYLKSKLGVENVSDALLPTW